jgi:uncharacterized protein (TIRG00374 family)
MSAETGHHRELVGDRVERAIERHADTAGEIERGERDVPPAKRLRKTIFWLAITGVSLYLVAPSVLDTLNSWRDITRFSIYWLAGMFLLQTASVVCVWALQRLALRMRRWRPVISSQLAGNALSKVAPGGGAMGAALQYKMLVQAGLPRDSTVGALTSVNLLTFGMVLVLPLLAVPALLRGGVDRSLLETAIVGLVVAVIACVIGGVLLATDRPLAWVGRTVQRIRNRLRRKSEPLHEFPTRLLAERDRILATLGPRWKRALLATAGRWGFDYATLLAALAAIGSHPRPGLVLLAFCGAQVLAQIPITPGGLGFVEAGLTAMLVLTGVSAGEAVLATFAYRLFQYWLPLPAGLVGLALQRGAVERSANA